MRDSPIEPVTHVRSADSQERASVVVQQPGSHESPQKITAVLVSLAILSLAGSFLFFVRFQGFYTDDSYSYMIAAQNMAAGRGFTNAAGYPEVIRTPGYPLLITLFLRLGLGGTSVVIFQHLLRLAMVIAIALAVFRLTRSRTQSCFAGLVLCLDLPTLDTANELLTETLFTAVLCIVLWLLWDVTRPSRPWAWSLLAGLLAAVATLIRPAALFFFVPAAAYLLFARPTSRIKSTLSFLLAFGCPLFLWGARNLSQTGSFTLFPISAWNMLGYRAAGVLAINDPGSFEKNFARRQAELVNEVCQEMQPTYGNPCLPLIKPQAAIPQKSVYYMRLGQRIVLQHPFSYLKLGIRGAGLIMLGDDANQFAQLTGLQQGTAAKVLLLYTVPALGLSLVGAWCYWRSDRRILVLLVTTIVYFVAITAGAEGYSRYRAPVVPGYAILIAAGADSVWRRLQRKVQAAVSSAPISCI